MIRATGYENKGKNSVQRYVADGIVSQLENRGK